MPRPRRSATRSLTLCVSGCRKGPQSRFRSVLPALWRQCPFATPSGLSRRHRDHRESVAERARKLGIREHRVDEGVHGQGACDLRRVLTTEEQDRLWFRAGLCDRDRAPLDAATEHANGHVGSLCQRQCPGVVEARREEPLRCDPNRCLGKLECATPGALLSSDTATARSGRRCQLIPSRLTLGQNRSESASTNPISTIGFTGSLRTYPERRTRALARRPWRILRADGDDKLAVANIAAVERAALELGVKERNVVLAELGLRPVAAVASPAAAAAAKPGAPTHAATPVRPGTRRSTAHRDPGACPRSSRRTCLQAERVHR